MAYAHFKWMRELRAKTHEQRTLRRSKANEVWYWSENVDNKVGLTAIALRTIRKRRHNT